jgi:hypothetical protein
MANDVSTDVNISRITGSLNRGGWQIEFTGLNDTDISEKHQEIVVQLQGAFGGPPGAPRPVFKGYVMPIQLQFNRTESAARFIAETSDGILRKGWVQGLGLADTDTDARDHYHQWDSITGAGVRMTMGRMVEHILGFYDQIGNPPASNPDWIAHTNMVFHPTQNPAGWITLDNVETTPFDAATNPEGTMRVDRYNVRETDNLWARLREIARNEFFEMYFDKSDTLWYQRHPMYLQSLPVPVMTFDEDFCVVPPIVNIRDADRVKQVRLHAVTDEGDTLHGWYPFTNAVSNPSVEWDIVGWFVSGAAVAIRSNAQAYDGTYSVEVTTTVAVNDGTYYLARPGLATSLFTCSVWVYQAAGGATVQIRVRDQTNGTETAGGGVVLAAATWTQLTVNHTTGANPCDDLRLYVETTVGAAIVLYVDAAQMVPPAEPIYSGKREITRVRCNDQGTLNEWARRMWYFETRPYSVRWTAPGLGGLLFEILDRIQITYTGTTANGVHIDWTEEKFWIHEISVNPSEGFGGTSTFLLEAENTWI